MNFKKLLPKVKAFAFDVDGVFAQSKVFLHEKGRLVRSMNTKDGYATQHAVKKGYPFAIITGGQSLSVKERFVSLGVKECDIYLASKNKLNDLNDFIKRNSLKAENILYMGDDMPDIEVMQMVGIPTCPIDAIAEIKEIALYISAKKGGDGCVRDLIEQVLKAQNKWSDNKDYLIW